MVKYKKFEKYTKPRNDKEFLELAMYRELAAVGFYDDMSRHEFSADVKKLICELRDEEKAHRTRLERKLSEHTKQ